jgi:uncharacterized membrane protein YecN with MAPEG domain
MEPVFLVIVLALIEYFVFSALVGRARAKYRILAPATTGHPDFERVYRVHQNTLESLVAFVPSAWLFGLYLSVTWATVLGALFIVARAIYAVGYMSAAEKRSVGAGLTGIVNLILVAGALVGVVRALL